MAKVILGVTISLDGFAEDNQYNVEPLYPDLEALHESAILKESIRDTGAVVMDWKEFAMAEDPDWWAGNYEYQTPIFVVTNQAPEKHPKETESLKFYFVTDGWQSAINQAQQTAGNRLVTIIGSALTTRQCLSQKLADELHLDIIPFFLGQGYRPFEDQGLKSVHLERQKTVEMAEGRVHIEYRIA